MKEFIIVILIILILSDLASIKKICKGEYTTIKKSKLIKYGDIITQLILTIWACFLLLR